MREAKPLAAAAGCCREGACEGCGLGVVGYRLAPSRVRRRRLCAGAVGCERAGAGIFDPLDGAGAGERRCARERPPRQGRADGRCGCCVEHGFHGRRRGDPCRSRRRNRAADPPRIRIDRRQARGLVHALARRRRERRARHARGKPRGCGGPRLPGQHGAGACRRRQRACRSHQDHARGRQGAAYLVVDGRRRRARALQHLPVHHRRRGDTQPAVPALWRRGNDRKHSRRHAA